MTLEYKIEPIGDRVFIERILPEETSKGGIYIPDNAKEKPQRGVVRAVGGGQIREDGSIRPMTLRVGDVVLFGKYAGTSIEGDTDTYLMMREDDVLGVIRE